jgi:opacity protein-like surface antigen
MLMVMSAVLAGPSFAQGTSPAEGTWAVGASAGVAIPTEDLFGSGLTAGVSAERFFSPRVSARGQLSGAFWNFTDFEDDTASPLAINGTLVYNWDRGLLRPYLTAGFGWYNFRFTEAEIDESDAKFGLVLGGGVEYAFTGSDSVTGELLIHAITGEAEGTFAEYGAAFWSLTGGYKKYF